MADEPSPPEKQSEEQPEGEPEFDQSSEITPAMNEQEIRNAGLAIDVPFESGMAKPQRLRYADLGGKKYGEVEPEEPPEPEEETSGEK
jgi:hypothetical protein